MLKHQRKLTMRQVLIHVSALERAETAGDEWLEQEDELALVAELLGLPHLVQNAHGWEVNPIVWNAYLEIVIEPTVLPNWGYRHVRRYASGECGCAGDSFGEGWCDGLIHIRFDCNEFGMGSWVSVTECFCKDFPLRESYRD